MQFASIGAPIVNTGVPTSTPGSSILSSNRPPVNTNGTTISSGVSNLFHGMKSNGESGDANWNPQNGRKMMKRRRSGEDEDDEDDDPTKEASTLLLVAVPPEKNNDKEIRAFFSKFGKINSTESWVNHRKAFVKFFSRAEALAAFRSKCAIFDDRNVKIVLEKETTRDKPHKFSIYVPRSHPTLPQNPPGLELSSKPDANDDNDEIVSPEDYDDDDDGYRSHDSYDDDENNSDARDDDDYDDDDDDSNKSELPPAKKVRITGVTSSLFSSAAKPTVSSGPSTTSSSSLNATASSSIQQKPIVQNSTGQLPKGVVQSNEQVNANGAAKNTVLDDESEKTRRMATDLKKKIDICTKLIAGYSVSNDATKKIISEKVAKTIMEVDIALWPAGRPKARPQLPGGKTPTPSSPLPVFVDTLKFIGQELSEAIERPGEHRKCVEEAKAEMAERHKVADQQKKFLSQVSVYSPKLPDGIRSVESVKGMFKGVKKVLFYSDSGKISSVISFYNHNYAESVNIYHIIEY